VIPLLSPYNLGFVKSRSRQPAGASAYRATRSPPKRDAAGDPRGVPYPVTLVRDEEDGAEWMATIDALPGCSARGSSPDEALEQVTSAAAAWVETARREGREVPEAKTAQSHSGRLLLRMPQTMHAELARAAERERISLNQFITDALAGALGWRAPSRDAPRATRAVPTDAEATVSAGTKTKGPRISNAVFVANGVIVAVAALVAIVVLIATLR
jgi:predicted RNase H-like HicB family nuclease